MSEGQKQYQALIDGGFTLQEAEAWKQEQSQKLLAGGFTVGEMQDYFGDGEPDTSELHGVAQNDLNRIPGAQTSQTIMGDVLAGWQRGSIGLSFGKPNVNPRDAGMASAISFSVGQMTSDIPAMTAGLFAGVPVGGAIGAAGGSVIGPEGTVAGGAIGGVAGGGFGSFAMPEAYRGIMMDHYRKGSITSFSDFWSRYTGIMWETAKAGVTGAVAAPIGGKAGALALKATGQKTVTKTIETATGRTAVQVTTGGNKLAGSTADVIGMTATATEVGGLLNGHQPDAADFATGAITVLGFHGAARLVGTTQRPVLTPKGEAVQENMRKVYEETGVPPWEQAKRAAENPEFRQSLYATDVNDEAITTTWRRIKPEEAAPYKAGPGKIAAEHDAEIQGLFSQAMKDMRSKDEQLDLIAELEGSAGFAKQHGITEGEVTSPKGAIGRFQIMPDTARQYGFDPARLTDHDYNRKVAEHILGELNKRYSHIADPSKRMEAVLIAYNAGPGRADRWAVTGDDRKLPVETQRYVERARRAGALSIVPTLEAGGANAAGGAGGAGGKPPGREVSGVASAEVPGGGGEKPFDLNPEMLEQEALGLVSKPEPRSYLDAGKDLMSTAYDEVISELGPAKRYDKMQGVKANEIGLEDMTRSTYASAERAGVFMRNGAFEPITFEATGKPGDNMTNAYKVVKKNGGTAEGFVAYRLARRYVEKMSQGIDTGLFAERTKDAEVRLKMAARLIDAGRTKYQESADIMRRLNDSKLDYVADSGLYSRDQVATWKLRNKEWIPHERVVEDVGKISVRTRSKQARQTIKTMEGSQRQIVEPVAAEIASFHTQITMADRNRAVGHVVGDMEQAKADGFKMIERLPSAEVLDKDGNVIKEHVGPDETAEAYKKTEGRLGPEDFVYYRDGQAEIWRAPGNEPLAKMFRGATPVDASVVTKGLRWFASIQRSGITSLPDYIAKMTIRDQFYTPIVNKNGGIPFQNLVIGAMHAIKQDETYLQFVRSGGMGASIATMDAKYIQRDVQNVFNNTNTWLSVANAVSHPVELMRIWMERVDAMSRLGMQARRMPTVGRFKASMESRKAYLDFAEKGTSSLVNWWAGVTPFLRPRLLGFDQLGHALKEDATGVFIRGLGYIGIPTAALYALNWMQDQAKDEDDPTRWDKIDRWVRDTNFILPEIGGVRIKMPRSQGEMGLAFGGLVERSLEWQKNNDPRAFNDWAQNFIGQFRPNFSPALATPMLEHITNKSFYTWKPLIPGNLEEASGYMQYTPNTTEIAKKLSQVLSSDQGAGLMEVSPIVLENYARQWTGTLGLTVLKTLNASFNQSAKPFNLADIPFVGSFIVRNDTMQLSVIQDYYDAAADVRRRNKDFSLAIKRGNEGEITASSDHDAAFIRLQSFTEAIGVQYATIQAINQDKEMNVDEKRQFIDTTYRTMIAMSRAGLSLVDAINGSKAAQ